jgi:hypothetical protein
MSLSISKTVLVHLKQDAHEDKPRIVLFDSDMTAYGYVFIRTETITVNVVNSRKFTLAQIKSLEAQQAKIKADAIFDCERIKDEISILLQLTDKTKETTNDTQTE